jgi:hypothetical protein
LADSSGKEKCSKAAIHSVKKYSSTGRYGLWRFLLGIAGPAILVELQKYFC